MFCLDDFRHKGTIDAGVTSFINLASPVKVFDLASRKDPFELIPVPVMADTSRCRLYQHLPRQKSDRDIQIQKAQFTVLKTHIRRLGRRVEWGGWAHRRQLSYWERMGGERAQQQSGSSKPQLGNPGHPLKGCVPASVQASPLLYRRIAGRTQYTVQMSGDFYLCPGLRRRPFLQSRC
jgi:hypothetical protein